MTGRRRSHFSSSTPTCAAAEVAAEVGVTPNALVLAWLLHQTSPAIVPLIGPRTLQQYEAALPALDVTLTDEQFARLDTATG